jgi:VWFA-related protein
MVVACRAAAQYGETIEVARILLDIRVTNYDGDPIRELQPKDFRVTIGGKRADVESVTWVEDAGGSAVPAAAPDATPESLAEDPSTTAPGRLIVVFVQTDFARDKWRLRGELNFLQHVDDLVDAFAPNDRIAVFSFDSHLKFRLDLSTDHEAVKAAIRRSILVDQPPAPAAVTAPSLAGALDRKAMRDAASSEKGLLLVANALRPIAGAKTLLLLGWGLGELVMGSAPMRPEWVVTRHALDASRTSVMSLDTSYSDYHSLEYGLRQAADETGGLYEKTHLFPMVAIEKVRRTLAGHYELELRRPASLARGTHAVVVKVQRRGVTLLAPRSFTDR